MPDRLVIVQRRLTHYRVPLFEELRPAMADAGFELCLVIGDPTDEERLKGDEGRISWAKYVPCRYALGGRLCWQSLGQALAGAGFVIVTQENRLLANLPLLFRPQARRVALWGHGRNFQAKGRPALAQRVKRTLIRRADWCFAYTEISAQLMRQDVPGDRVTVLNNAIDTSALQADLRVAQQEERSSLRRDLGLGAGPVGLFIGSLYDDKRLDVLVDAAEAVRAGRPGFELVIAGSGPLGGWLERRTAHLPWLHRPGAVRGMEKARWLSAADLMLNPGLVGLGILDAFAARLPMITTDCGVHSPEIAYLEPGNNGMMVAPTAAAVAEAALRLLDDEALNRKLRQGCARSAQVYTLQAMVERFVAGVIQWRNSVPRWQIPA